MFPSEKPNQENDQQAGNEQNVEKSHGFIGQGKAYIHPEKAGHQGWNHQDNGGHRKPLNEFVEIVRNDTGIGFHSPGQDIGMTVGHIERLVIVDQDIFKQIRFFFIL